MFLRFPRITILRVVFVGLVVWAFSIAIGFYTDSAPLPAWAAHFPAWMIVAMRKWPFTFPLFWLAATGFFAYWQTKRLPPAPPVRQGPTIPGLSSASAYCVIDKAERKPRASMVGERTTV